MLQFIVLGQIPGTHTFVDFSLLLNIFGIMTIVVLTYVLLKRAIRRAFTKRFKFIQLELTSL